MGGSRFRLRVDGYQGWVAERFDDLDIGLTGDGVWQFWFGVGCWVGQVMGLTEDLANSVGWESLVCKLLN